MRARVVVFPIKGRNWCFSRSLDSAAAQEPSAEPQQLRDLFRNITSTRRSVPENAEIVADFMSEKMNRAWVTLEKAQEGTLKSKLHSLGLWLLSRVKPSEVFLKSVSKDLTEVEIAYPASCSVNAFYQNCRFRLCQCFAAMLIMALSCLNPRLVRRRLRHIAMRGTAIHRKHLYGSVALLPLTSVLTVLPLPNVPFFWILFRAYSHWKALKGSERLVLLVSDCSSTWSSITNNEKGNDSKDESDHGAKAEPRSPWVLKPSEDLEKLIVEWKSGDGDGVGSCTINAICEEYSLDKNHVLKFKDSL